jgi:2-methylcitrate dehydratase PrpD
METAATETDVAAGITEQLADLGSSLTLDRVPEDAKTNAKQCLLDWLGVTLAGSQDELTQILHETAEMEGLGDQASLIGRGGRGSASQAALINGAAGHALDYDDVVRIFRGHPTAPVAPAVLAVSERDGHNGADLLTALLAGIEVEGRVGGYMGDPHYLKGWHATGTLGHFGAAVGVARLLGLDAEKTALAMGIAGTQAAGLKANFGTMCKPLHAGKAAMNGLLAAEWAKRGFDSRPDIVERKGGLCEVLDGAGDLDTALDGLGEKFCVSNMLFKYHAACYGVHSPVESAKRIAANDAFDPAKVEKVEVHHAARLKGMCDIPEPTNGLEIKFSLYMTVAMALSQVDTGALDVYSEETAANPGLVALRQKVVLVPKDDFTPNQSEVIVHQSDGTVLREHDDLAKPNRDLDDQWAKLSAKFRALAVPLVGEDRTEAAIAAIRDLEKQKDTTAIAAALSKISG